MTKGWKEAFGDMQVWAHAAGFFLIAASAGVAVAATALGAAGLLPWPEIAVSYGGAEIAGAGALVQIAVTILLLLLCLFLPSVARILRLEASHRTFAIGMEDVTRAYRAVHAADREGVFTLSREYDAVRERLAFLRAHPDLGALDGQVLELAAQMGHEARELARIYSDDKVRRARESLEARRHLAEELDRRISEAHCVTAELRRELDAVEIDEDMVRSRLARLRAEIAELTPASETPRARRSRIGVVPGE